MQNSNHNGTDAQIHAAAAALKIDHVAGFYRVLRICAFSGIVFSIRVCGFYIVVEADVLVLTLNTKLRNTRTLSSYKL